MIEKNNYVRLIFECENSKVKADDTIILIARNM